MADKQVDESINAITDQNISPAEVSPVQSFLSGKNCLHGASIHNHYFFYFKFIFNNINILIG